MNKSMQIFQRLQQHRIIALLSPKSPEQCVTAYEVLTPLGVTLEIAFRSKPALEGVWAVLQKYPDALVLAGTVMLPEQAEQAIEAGVAGIVSADVILDVVRLCAEHDVMCVPGGLGDVGKQLVEKARAYGLTLDELREHVPYQWVHKLFPAVAGDLNFQGLAKAWRGPFRGLNVVYTGGVNSGNLQRLVAGDPAGIYCGSALTKAVDTPEEMRKEAAKWVEIIQKAG